MGRLVSEKHVLLPNYVKTDHTPPSYKDPSSDRFIPVGCFLNNLDQIGPAHWHNPKTADYLLKIVKPQEVDYYCDFFNRFYKTNNLLNRNLRSLNQILRNNRIMNNVTTTQQQQYEQLANQRFDENTLSVSCSDRDCTAADAAALTSYFNVMLINYQQMVNNYISTQRRIAANQEINNCGIPSPPLSPRTSGSTSHSTRDTTQKFAIAPNPPPAYYFYTHTLVLATQSGFFNQLFGPINTTPSNGTKLPSTLIIPVPFPECMEPILYWLYHHDDNAWLDVINEENFEKFYWNIRFLKLGKEAYDVLDEWIEEMLEEGNGLGRAGDAGIIQDW